MLKELNCHRQLVTQYSHGVAREFGQKKKNQEKNRKGMLQ